MYYLYDDTNDNGQLDSEDELLHKNPWGFTGCGEMHHGVMNDDNLKANGFLVDGRNRTHSVFYWESDTGYHSMVPGKSKTEKYDDPAHPNRS